MTVDLIQIRALRVAAAVADQGSFAAAGRHLNLPRAAISRIIGQLEEQSGNRFFRRNTRKVVTTEAGEAMLVAARRILAEIDTAFGPIEPKNAELSGQVRMSVSHAFGRSFVLPLISKFRGSHPKVHVEALLQDRLDDMVEEDIDFTVRLGPLPVSDLVVRRVGTVHSGLFAAPSIVRSLDGPFDRKALKNVPAIGFRIPGTGQILSWPVHESGSVTHAVVPRSVVASDSIEAVLDFARQGHGVALLPRYLVLEDLAEKRLEPIFTDLVSMQTEVHICFREKRFMPRRVRALIDHLAKEISSVL